MTVGNEKNSVVYHPRYKLGTSWLKHLHKLDMDKSGDIYRSLMEKGIITQNTIYKPGKATASQLRAVHSAEYVDHKLKDKHWLSKVFKLKPLVRFPIQSPNIWL